MTEAYCQMRCSKCGDKLENTSAFRVQPCKTCLTAENKIGHYNGYKEGAAAAVVELNRVKAAVKIACEEALKSAAMCGAAEERGRILDIVTSNLFFTESNRICDLITSVSVLEVLGYEKSKLAKSVK